MVKLSESKITRVPWGLIILILLFPAIMIPLDFVDMLLTVQLNKSGWEAFGKVMQRTLFNGGKPGLTDPAIILLLVNLGFYLYYSRKRASERLNKFRPLFGFVFFCSLFTGLGLVHSLKWVLGRARPYLVLDGKLPFSNWYEFGPQFVTDGIYYGSFPSGHTATIFLLITLSYYLINHPGYGCKEKIAGWIWGGVVMIMTLMMIMGRSITLDHWLSDSIGMSILSWIFIHLIYFYILKIPAQVRYVEAHKDYADLPRYWEIILLWRLFLITIGVMSVLIGIRSLFIKHASWLAVIVIPGLFLILYFSKSLLKVYRDCMIPFQPFYDSKTPEMNHSNPT